jgi:two-component system response regulator YesN
MVPVPGRVSHAVLVIDDDIGTREGFSGFLHSAGFVVTTASTGHEGLDIARRQLFNVILADLRLPDISGIDVLRALRTDRRDVAMVIVTGFGSVTSAVEALKLRALDFVEKPLDGEHLIEVVQSAARAAATTRNSQRADAEGSLGEIPSEPVPTDPRAAAVLRLIDQRYREVDLSVASIAVEINLSIGHMCLLLKRETGHSVGAHLHSRRIAEAKKRLQHTTLSIKEIAFRVGYRSTSRFDHHFLRRCGLTPMAYRRRIWQEFPPE